jgi:GTPase Era involved in 16S rRNA processing
MQFINTATGRYSSTVNHGLESSTSDIKPIAIDGPDGHPLVFVDTPGFDSTSQSDENTWLTISDWLAHG